MPKTNERKIIQHHHDDFRKSIKSQAHKPQQIITDMLNPNMEMIHDEEGERVPPHVPLIVDSHVHVFPDAVFKAVWEWFRVNAYPIRYKLFTPQVFDFLLSRGINHVVALQYAHKPGIAMALNKYMAEACAGYKNRVTGLATVFPGEEDAVKILEDAFRNGLGGLKLHTHVQCFSMTDDTLYPIYASCSDNNKPIVIHAGREPKSNAYKCNPYKLCSADRVKRILKDFPKLRMCVPHMGFDELDAYFRLTQEYDNLWLDTTMVMTDYFRAGTTVDLNRYRPDRIMYGSDFPNIPFSWDREIRKLLHTSLPDSTRAGILGLNSADFFGIRLS